MNDLQQRKQELLLQSDLRRSLFMIELHNLQLKSSYLDRGAEFVQKTKPVWIALAPVLAYFAFKHRLLLVNAGKKLAVGFWVAQKALSFWHRSRSST